MIVAELPSFSETIRLALRLNPTVYTDIQVTPNGIWLALAVVLLAAFSESLGQSVILFLNRVQPKRFIVALLISTFSNMVGYFLWVYVVWLILRYAFNQDVPIWVVANAVGLAYAPQLFAFFELTPFLGNMFGLLLTLWSMAAIIVALQAGFGLAVWQAAAASALGWLLIQVWRRSLGKPLYALGRLVNRRVAGVPLEITLEDASKIRRLQPNIQNIQIWLDARRRVIDDHLSALRKGNIKNTK